MDDITDSMDVSLSKLQEIDSEGQGSLACCSPRGHKGSDTTEQLNNNNSLAKRRGILMENFWERLSSQLK